MAEIVYNGKTYTRNNSKWIDRDYMVVHETLQRELNQLYLKTLDLSSYSLKDLISEGDKFKESYTYDYAIAFYEKAVEYDADSANEWIRGCSSDYNNSNHY